MWSARDETIWWVVCAETDIAELGNSVYERELKKVEKLSLHTEVHFPSSDITLEQLKVGIVCQVRLGSHASNGTLCTIRRSFQR